MQTCVCIVGSFKKLAYDLDLMFKQWILELSAAFNIRGE